MSILVLAVIAQRTYKNTHPSGGMVPVRKWDLFVEKDDGTVEGVVVVLVLSLLRNKAGLT